MGRRAVLTGLTAGIAFPLLSRLDGQIHQASDPRLIRPPGSLTETLFLERCQRCGLCMKACPTNVISPALGEAGLAGIWTPVLNMATGYCEYSCTLCSSVCPTSPKAVVFREADVTGFGAERLRLKQPYVNLRQCVGCGICENKCPVKGTPAIRVIASGESRSPKNQILLIS
jgi:ferredoxin